MNCNEREREIIIVWIWDRLGDFGVIREGFAIMWGLLNGKFNI